MRPAATDVLFVAPHLWRGERARKPLWQRFLGCLRKYRVRKGMVEGDVDDGWDSGVLRRETRGDEVLGYVLPEIQRVTEDSS